MCPGRVAFLRALEGLVRGVSGRCGEGGPPSVGGRVIPREASGRGGGGVLRDQEDSNSGTQTPEGSGGGGRLGSRRVQGEDGVGA